jgi:hypothetical protein
MKSLLKTTTAIPGANPSSADTIRPAYCSIDHWSALTDMSRRSVYDALGRGDLRAIKVGSKTLVDVEFGMNWLRSRPAAVIRAPRERQRVAA